VSQSSLRRLRSEVAQRKWIVWVALLCVLVLALGITIALLPHHVLNALLQIEEQSNGTRELAH
jgi:uncharacterized protein involved in exopolysaccharide biosynthesis